MFEIMKKQGKTVKAYCLGAENPEIVRLISEGKIIALENGFYELMSQEAIKGGSGHGELAKTGDYVKLDNNGFPYPNARDFFDANHRHISGDNYEQIPKPLFAWTIEDPMCPEIEFLLKQNRLQIREDSQDKFFSAFLWGTLESAARDAIVVLYDVTKESTGTIKDISFNFIDRDEFNRTYNVIKRCL